MYNTTTILEVEFSFEIDEINVIPHNLAGIYQIFSDNKISYIGETVNIRKRLKEHLRTLQNYKHTNKELLDYWIISNYGYEPFLKFKILEIIDIEKDKIKEILLEKELEYIYKNKSKPKLANKRKKIQIEKPRLMRYLIEENGKYKLGLSKRMVAEALGVSIPILIRNLRDLGFEETIETQPKHFENKKK